MEFLGGILPWIQIALAIPLIGSILLQQTGAGAGGAFGGGDSGGVSHTRRGMEKILFRTTIVLGVLFALTAFTALLI